MTKKKINLDTVPEEELIDQRICDLSLRIDDTWLADCVQKLYSELDSKNLYFKPECYLADEWLTPEEEPVVGIPFYLAHPALMKLEHKMMLEVEGGTKQWCAKLLRHETGHAINYAYRLFKQRKWVKIFGHYKKEYLDTYKYRPYSRSFVRHLEDYYAQYHPDEDFAETFSVWLTPDLDWRNIYRGWKALEKLEYVDALMNEIKDKEPIVKKGKKYWMASSLRIRLRNYYKKRRHDYAEDFPDFHDANLKRMFMPIQEFNKETHVVYELIRRYRSNIIQNVSACTGEKKYIVGDFI